MNMANDTATAHKEKSAAMAYLHILFLAMTYKMMSGLDTIKE